MKAELRTSPGGTIVEGIVLFAQNAKEVLLLIAMLQSRLEIVSPPVEDGKYGVLFRVKESSLADSAKSRLSSGVLGSGAVKPARSTKRRK